MFMNEERCLLQKNQLGEVICQLRFPDILIIGTQPPAEFQELIRGQFPIYAVRKEAPAPKVTGTPGNLSIENSPAIINHQFATADGVWRVLRRVGTGLCAVPTLWRKKPSGTLFGIRL